MKNKWHRLYDHSCGTIFIISKFYNTFITISLLNSFTFKIEDFIKENESKYEYNFNYSLCDGEIRIVAYKILKDLILITFKVVVSRENSPKKS